MMGALLPLALLVPAAMAYACIAPGRRQRMVGWLWLAPLPALAAALLAWDSPALVLMPAAQRLTLVLDRPGAVLLGGAALLWSAAGAYAAAYLRGKPGNGPFAVWWLLTLFGNLGVFIAGDLVTFYICFAFVSLAAYGLVVHDGTASARRSGAIYLVLALLGEVALLLAFVLLANGSGGDSVAIADVVAALPAAPRQGLIVLLLVIGFGLKAGLVPLHVWLPVAHPAAPMPASAVLSGAIVKAGIIGLIRFLPAEAALWPDRAGPLLVGLGLLTAFYAVAVGVTQRNPKTVLAYSTVSQMGLLVAVLAAGAGAPVTAYYGLAHLLAKGALFLSVGVVAAGRRRWALLLPVAVVGLGMAGLPLTGGALAKLAIKPAMGGGLVGLLASLSGAGSTLLMLHFLRRLAATPPEGKPVPAGMLVPWALLLAGALAGPWLLLPQAGLPGTFYAATPGALWDCAWPVLLGCTLAVPLLPLLGRLPALPEGDIVVGLERASHAAAGCIGPVTRMEAWLREWSVAGIGLLVIALLLAGTMLIGR